MGLFVHISEIPVDDGDDATDMAIKAALYNDLALKPLNQVVKVALFAMMLWNLKTRVPKQVCRGDEEHREKLLRLTEQKEVLDRLDEARRERENMLQLRGQYE